MNDALDAADPAKHRGRLALFHAVRTGDARSVTVALGPRATP